MVVCGFEGLGQATVIREQGLAEEADRLGRLVVVLFVFGMLSIGAAASLMNSLGQLVNA